MAIKPILHRIVVKPEEVLETDDVYKRAKSLGIEIQLDKREQAGVEYGTVIEVGSTAFTEFGTTAEAQGVVPGAKITFARYAGKTIKDGETRLVVLNDEDCVGVITDG